MEFRNLIDQNLNENFFAILAIKIRGCVKTRFLKI